MMGDKRATAGRHVAHLARTSPRLRLQYLDQGNELRSMLDDVGGLSTRFIGAIIMGTAMTGLIMPPALPRSRSSWCDLPERCRARHGARGPRAGEEHLVAGGVRGQLDERDGGTPGFKFNDWRCGGVPLRIEIGPRDVREALGVWRGATPGQGGQVFAPEEGLTSRRHGHAGVNSEVRCTSGL